MTHEPSDQAYHPPHMPNVSAMISHDRQRQGHFLRDQRYPVPCLDCLDPHQSRYRQYGKYTAQRCRDEMKRRRAMFVDNGEVCGMRFVPKFPVESVEMLARLGNVSAGIGLSCVSNRTL